jgi:hypothetical protein
MWCATLALWARHNGCVGVARRRVDVVLALRCANEPRGVLNLRSREEDRQDVIDGVEKDGGDDHDLDRSQV